MYFEVSAKEGTCVDEAFNKLSETMLDVKYAKEEAAAKQEQQQQTGKTIFSQTQSNTFESQRSNS